MMNLAQPPTREQILRAARQTGKTRAMFKAVTGVGLDVLAGSRRSPSHPKSTNKKGAE